MVAMVAMMVLVFVLVLVLVLVLVQMLVSEALPFSGRFAFHDSLLLCSSCHASSLLCALCVHRRENQGSCQEQHCRRGRICVFGFSEMPGTLGLLTCPA